MSLYTHAASICLSPCCHLFWVPPPTQEGIAGGQHRLFAGLSSPKPVSLSLGSVLAGIPRHVGPYPQGPCPQRLVDPVNEGGKRTRPNALGVPGPRVVIAGAARSL